MAHYLYRCKECSVYQTKNHSVSEDPEVPCPTCGDQMKRQPQAIGIELKGTGWGKDR